VADVVQMDDAIFRFVFWGKITSWNKGVRGKNKTVLFQFPAYKCSDHDAMYCRHW